MNFTASSGACFFTYSKISAPETSALARASSDDEPVKSPAYHLKMDEK
jgi:hypothetical protein